MSCLGLNVCTLAGIVSAIHNRTVNPVEIFIDVDKVSKDPFSVMVIVWNNSLASDKIPYIKNGSLIIITGSIEPSPYISEYDDQPYAGLRLTASDIFLDASPQDQYETLV
jgi:hypothetical protein